MNPFDKQLKSLMLLLPLIGLFGCQDIRDRARKDSAQQHQDMPPEAPFNSFTDEEKAAGWELLFDGSDPGITWKSISGAQFPDTGWCVENDALVLLPGRHGGDIITRERFSDFELMLDYKLADSANTGIKYFVSELKTAQGEIVLNGPEYQLIDDYKHESVKNNSSPETSTGSVYLLYAPEGKKLNGPGAWNHVKITAKGNRVTHWINGKQIVSYERGSAAFRGLVADTKFNQYQTPYGEAASGHILLQDHNDKAYFRNIKIRRLN